MMALVYLLLEIITGRFLKAKVALEFSPEKLSPEKLSRYLLLE